MRFVALILCAACALVFLLQSVIGTESLLLISSVKWSEPWRLLTSIFAHGSIVHLLSNLFALGLFGLILEGRIGSQKVLWLFLLSGVVINVFSPYPRSLGASGAIFAIIGALAILRPKIMVWVGGMPVPMILAAVIWLFQDIMGVFVPDGVGNLAHISGLGIGVIAGFAWRKRFGDPLFKKEDRDLELDKKLDEWEEKYMG
ncbi:rhomboid family intramembrane serine protease [Candidatus Woesearchaeota archaeon]|nr:rhomboid family intramembrane serine protease [Candidatus Woesearchaeota archaeon]